MEQQSIMTGARFQKLLQRSAAKREIWDVVLTEVGDCVVAPTMGAIMPNWLLLVPRNWSLNFASRQVSELDAFKGVKEAAYSFGSNRWIWFEHGPSHVGSDIGCGVDHAHIHLLIEPTFTLEEFAAKAKSQSSVKWDKVPPETIYSRLGGDKDYYVFGDESAAYFIVGHNLGRQFFRKVIANLLGRPAEWDYKAFPQVENVEKTICELSSQLRAA